MAYFLPFIDSFDHYTTANVLKKWSAFGTLGNGILNDAEYSRFGGGQAYVFGGLGELRQGFLDTNITTLCIGSAVRYLSSPVTTKGEFLGSPIFQIGTLDSGFLVQLRYTHDGRLRVVVPAPDSLTFKTDTTAHFIHTRVYHFIEWEITIIANPLWPSGDHTLSSKVWIDDILVLTVTDIAFHFNSANVTTNYAQLGSVQEAGALMSYSGGVYMDRVRHPNSRVIVSKPNADTTPQQWIVSTGTAHFPVVDEVLLDTGDYVYTTNTVGVDEVFFHEDTPANRDALPTIVQPVFYGTWEDDPGRHIYSLYNGGTSGTGDIRNGLYTKQSITGTSIVEPNGTKQGVRYDV